jgi:hypothetical protein
MKKLVSLWLFFISIMIAGCQKKDNEEKDIKSPLFDMILDLYQNSAGLNQNTTYIGIDLSLVDINKEDELMSLLEEFCSDNNHTLLVGTLYELAEEGYVETDEYPSGTQYPTYFPNGLHFKFFSYTFVNENEFTIRLTMWRGGLGAIIATFRATYQDGLWEVVKVSYGIA